MRTTIRHGCAWLAVLLMAATAYADTVDVHAPLRPDQVEFRKLFRELVETDTSASSGDCTLAATRMAEHLYQAGYRDDEIEVFTPEGHPREGGLIARLAGSEPEWPAMLLVDHLDVVEARHEDWGHDPFQLREQDGYFYGRGVIDDKALSAIWVDTFIRLRRQGIQPLRTIKLALTCGEEGQGINGVKWLLAHRPDALTAGFAFNEGGYGLADEAGGMLALHLAVGEKSSRSYQLEVRGPGGHSSQPGVENPIYILADALHAVAALEFPARLDSTSQLFLQRTGELVGGELGQAMKTVAANPGDADALRIVSASPAHVGVLRTTCVTTMLEGGHAENALPQQAKAHVQCRLLPGEDSATVERSLQAAIADVRVSISEIRRHGGGEVVVAVPPPLTAEIFEPAERVAARHFPGVPVIPKLLTAGTDGRYLSVAGIPTYGIPGIALDPDGNGAHGINERVGISSLFQGRDYLYELILDYAGAR